VNTLPTLAGATNVTISELVGYTQSLVPQDSDVPVQSLTATLVSGPTGLVVTNGVLAWTPTEAQGPSTNEITVTVTDGVGTVTNSFVITVLEENTLPTLAGATNATISELAGYTQNLVPGDVDIPAQSLTVTLVSGPAGLMVTNGVLAWTPTEEQGPSTNEITVVVTDGVGTVTNSFLIAVLEENTLPTLAGATNATISELVGYTQNLVPGDVDIPAQSLTVTLVSGPAGLVVTNGVLAWTPTEAQGPSTNEITVMVTDGLGTATRTLVLTVTELNDVPTISTISDQTTLEDTATSAIAFTVGDVETAAGSLTVTATSSNLGVVDTNGIALGGSGTNRTITLTPVANASGTNTITVTVTDGSGGSATRSFVLIVTPVPDVQTLEGFLLGAGLMPVVGGDGRYRLEASLGQAIAGSLPKVGSLDLASGFWFLDRLADALPDQLGDIPTPAQAAKGLVLQRATVAASRTDRLSSGTAPQMASGVRLPEARIRVAAVGDTAKVRILVSGLPKARWRVHSREGFGAGSWRDDGILQLDGEGEGFLETSGGDASAMRFYRLVQP
jgi:hypothetical protein